jgi:hypothetical protein
MESMKTTGVLGCLFVAQIFRPAGLVLLASFQRMQLFS